MAAFLDASVLIRAIERPDGESGRLLDQVAAGKKHAVVDEQVLAEVDAFFRAHRSPAFARQFTDLLRETVLVISHAEAIAYQTPAHAHLPPKVRLHRYAARAGGATSFVVDRGGGPPYPDESTPRAFAARDFWRSVLFSLVVGTTLVLINVRPTTGPSGAVEGPDPVRIFLNYLVPFCVASFSAYWANKARLRSLRGSA